MKVECEVIRDLMPLYVDGAASEGSRAMVEEHLAECEPCQEMLEEMRQEVISEPPRTEAGGVVQKLRRQRSKRIVLLVLLGVALTLVLAVFALRGWNYFYNDFVALTPMEGYSLELIPQEDVQVILNILNGQQQVLNAYFDEQTGELFLWSTTTRLFRKTEALRSISGGQLYYHEDYGYARKNWGKTYALVDRIYRGAPDSWYAEGEEPEREILFERQSEPDEAAVQEWFDKLRNMWPREFYVYETHVGR